MSHFDRGLQPDDTQETRSLFVSGAVTAAGEGEALAQCPLLRSRRLARARLLYGPAPLVAGERATAPIAPLVDIIDPLFPLDLILGCDFSIEGFSIRDHYPFRTPPEQELEGG